MICKYNEQNVCIGCLRTKQEITEWIDYTDEQKREVYKKIEQRSGGKINPAKNIYG